LSAANTYTGTTTVTGGALQAVDGTGLPSGNVLILDGGVLQGSGVTSFTRPIGTSGTTVQWTANGGGFAANGGQMTVNIGGASAEQIWGTTLGSTIQGPLIFGSTTANAKTLFVNGIDMNNSGVAATRTVTVNPGTGGDSAEISGVLRNSSGDAGLTKNGTGTLTLSANNTYTGATTISAGTLVMGSAGAVPSANALVLGGGTLTNATGGLKTISGDTTLSATSTLRENSAAENFTFSGSFTNSGGNRTLTGGNGAGTAAGVITLSGNVYLSEATGTGRTLTLAGATSSAPTFVVSGNIANFNGGAGTAGNITIGGTSAATAVTATLSGTNTHTGNTTLNTTSTLKIGSAGAFGGSTFVIGGNGSFDNTTGGALVLTTNMNQSGGSPTFIGTDDLTLGNVALSAANRTITVTAKTLTVGNVTQDASARNYTKSGAGTLLINGAGSYTGTTTISAGTLQLGNGGTTGSLSTSSAIVDNANLTINRSNAVLQGTDFTGNAITGSGSLTQAGSGTTTLSAANTYGGGTTVSAGTLTASGTGAKLGNANVTVLGTTLGTSLVIASGVTNAIADTATLSLAGGGTALTPDQGFADLGAGINETVATLILGGVTQAAGTYGGTGSSAAHILPEYFAADTGIITVPGVGTPGDFNGDGNVNAADYATWRKPDSVTPDPNGYVAFRENFQPSPVAGPGLGAAAVPEPMSVALLLLGLAGMGLRRQR
jgi:autotransporter-associated beta strand protein